VVWEQLNHIPFSVNGIMVIESIPLKFVLLRPKSIAFSQDCYIFSWTIRPLAVQYLFLMKSILLTALAAIMVTLAPAQNVLFSENFEPPGYADSVTSSTHPNGSAHWAVTGNLALNGQFADSCKVLNGGTSYLTTAFFDASSYANVHLSFWHICKINFFDMAWIQVTGDSGVTWTTLTAAQYLGAGVYNSLGNKFGPSSYGVLWAPTVNTAIPNTSWFRLEEFNISAQCASKTHSAVRFELTDGGSPSNPEYGWIIDDIKVTGANTVGLLDPGIPGLEVFLVQEGPALLIRWNENIPVAMDLTIFDALGRVTRSSSLHLPSREYIDLEYLVPGIYFYQLTSTDGRRISGKLVR
jgi:hypothetical protein